MLEGTSQRWFSRRAGVVPYGWLVSSLIRSGQLDELPSVLTDLADGLDKLPTSDARAPGHLAQVGHGKHLDFTSRSRGRAGQAAGQ
jgi:hypothetical protein